MPTRRRTNTVRPCAAAASSLRTTAKSTWPSASALPLAARLSVATGTRRTIGRNFADDRRKYLLPVTADRSGRYLQLVAPIEERGLKSPSICGRQNDEPDGGDCGENFKPALHMRSRS